MGASHSSTAAHSAAPAKITAAASSTPAVSTTPSTGSEPGKVAFHWFTNPGVCNENYVFDNFTAFAYKTGGLLGTCASAGFTVAGDKYSFKSKIGPLPF